jgi:hypothetical protein
MTYPKKFGIKSRHFTKKMPGWLGFGKNGNGESGIPYWFSHNENEKSILASVEPSGLQFLAKMEVDDWTEWKSKFKLEATKALGFKVGEIEEGEVEDDIEWINNEK